MTNYIEEMMRMAEVKYYDRYYSCIQNKDLECKNECCVCDKAKEVFCYPDFTSEKQLEIIKLISSKNYLSTIQYEDGSRGFTVEYYQTDKYDPLVCHIVELTFEQALAQLATELMKAGELNKKKVKEILR